MNICGVSIRGLIFNILLFIFVFYLLKNQVENSEKIYEIYDVYLFFYLFYLIVKIRINYNEFLEKEPLRHFIFNLFSFLIFLFLYEEISIYLDYIQMCGKVCSEEFLESNRSGDLFKKPMNVIGIFLMIFPIIFSLIIKFLFNLSEKTYLYLVMFFSFFVFSHILSAIKELIIEEKETFERNKNKPKVDYEPDIDLEKYLSWIISSRFWQIFLAIAGFLAIQYFKFNLNFFKDFSFNTSYFLIISLICLFVIVVSIIINYKEKSTEASHHSFTPKSITKTKKEWFENFSDTFTWRNIKNNQILNYFLFLSLFILFATRFDSIGNIFNIPIFLFLLFLFSGLVLPVYFIQKKILTQINLEKTWEEIIFLSIKTASFVILFGLFSVFLWLIVELLSENRKETMMVIFQYWYKKTFLGWQLNYFIMLSLLSSLFIFLKFLHIQENR